MASNGICISKITGLFRDIHGYQFPVWKEKALTHKKSAIFYFTPSWSESRVAASPIAAM